MNDVCVFLRVLLIQGDAVRGIHGRRCIRGQLPSSLFPIDMLIDMLRIDTQSGSSLAP